MAECGTAQQLQEENMWTWPYDKQAPAYHPLECIESSCTLQPISLSFVSSFIFVGLLFAFAKAL